MLSNAEQGNPDFFEEQIAGLIDEGFVVEAGEESGHVKNKIFESSDEFRTWFGGVRDTLESSDDAEDDGNADNAEDDLASFYEREASRQANGENVVDESLSPKGMDEGERRAGLRDD